MLIYRMLYPVRSYTLCIILGAGAGMVDASGPECIQAIVVMGLFEISG